MLPKNEAKYIQSLHHKKFRNQHNTFIAEGAKLVAELLQRKPEWLQKIYATKEWINQHLPLHKTLPTSFVVEIEPFELEKISALQSPQLVLATATIPQHTYEESSNWLLVLDGIQDPGNMGTIIRTAHWFGISQVVCSPDCADVFSSKVVQASMGSIFQVQVVYQQLPDFFANYQQPVYGALLNGKNPVVLKNQGKGCLLIGSEGSGIRPDTLPFVTEKISIPGFSDAESLNAAVAAGILMNQAAG